jgi:hypothetical protein
MANTKYGKCGVYLSPVVVVGAYVPCELRGVVKIVGMSQAPIAWPIGEKDGQRALVIYKGLARALRGEPAEKVAAWWGLDLAAVKRWQSAGPIPLVPLLERQDSVPDARQSSPEDRSRAWSAPAEEGSPQAPPPRASREEPQDGPSTTRPWPRNWFPPVLEDEAQRQLPRAKRRKSRWEPWEDELVRTCPVQEVVRRTNRRAAAVWARRYRLGVSLLRHSKQGNSKQGNSKQGHSKQGHSKQAPSAAAPANSHAAIVVEPVNVKSQAAVRRGRASRTKGNTTVGA